MITGIFYYTKSEIIRIPAILEEELGDEEYAYVDVFRKSDVEESEI